MKSFFKNDKGEIHFGINGGDGFQKIDNFDVKILKNLGSKKLWRCTVCNDLRIGEIAPKQCPTCFAIDAFVEINEKEFLEMIK
ncbi:MAG: hypothetical protein PHH54_05230 [Candidatus Nanoarchaeia archaeon]|nr:hypothetical protein [Candidatus Nanoarchaeia archaeon]MDD5741360.1 hypothetical protein [Candidatus Nanoarchaeia archaeon]